MKLIIKLSPEITIKSDSVRLRFIKMLSSSIRNILRRHIEEVAVLRQWDHITVRIKQPESLPLLCELMANIPGIRHFLLVEEETFVDLNDIFEKVYLAYHDKLEHKTFCVRVKRRGKHSFTSIDAERYIGGGLNQRIESAKVKLVSPDVTVHLEIEDDKILLVKARYAGLGGLPIGSQEDVLSLISGGFDSGVASYQFIKRGCRVHYCFFNLGGAVHEIGVKQMAYHLWQKYGSSHKVRFIAVDFAPVVGEILEKVEDGQMGVILKRMMVRAASKLAQRYKIPALVTGEAVGQVSSQTLTNLSVIDEASDTLILRPLIVQDKENIIQLAKQIGTDELAKTMPEFCGVISKKPTVKAVRAKIEHEESLIDFTLLDKVISDAENIDIRQILEDAQRELIEVETTQSLSENDVIIDIRAPEEQEEHPLQLAGVEVKVIPFYRLATQFALLPQSKNYLLYCTQGVMSRLQALYLKEQGINNVKVYKGKHH